jgi:hypothetical protein
MINADVPDWQKGYIINVDPARVADGPDWQKVVLAYEAGDPRLIKDKPDWTKGIVKGAGSSVCTYDIANKLLLFDLTPNASDLDEYVAVTLSAEEAKIRGLILAVTGIIDPGEYSFSRYWYVEDEASNLLFQGDTESYLEDIAIYAYLLCSLTEDRWTYNNGDGSTDILFNWFFATNIDLSPGEHTLHLFTFAPPWSGLGKILRFKLWALYDITSILSYATIKNKGDDGITW